MAKPTRTRPTDPRQMSFLELLDDELDKQQGQLMKLPLEANDVGGELLAILSKGLYTNPLDCIREYVQNSVDAHATNVTIKVTGNSVMIFDDGNGMNLEELLQSRQFGLSFKSLTNNVGFRGIGIYSGFDLCRRLRITTTKAEDPYLHVLVFEFAAMKLELEEDKREKPNRSKTSLIKLLSEHTYIKREKSDFSADRHFTQVELQDISDTHIKQLSNRADFRLYLLQSLPIDFADEFNYKEVINEQLRKCVPGYNAVKIILQSDGLEDEIVAKDAISNLQNPSFNYICTSSGQQVAYYWACLNKDRARIQPPNRYNVFGDYPNYAGFVYKIKGFSIGNRHKLQAMFLRKPQLYPWYTGEIYVIDSNVIPNAERDDFETNQAKRALDLAVRDTLKMLESEAESFQARGVADERIERYQEEVSKIENQVLSNTQANEYDTYSRLDDILVDIQRQKSKSSTYNRLPAEDIIARAKRLQKQLRKEVDTPIPEATRRKRAVRSGKLVNRIPMPVVEPPPSAPVKNLPGILKDSSWELEGDIAILVKLVQESLEDVLTLGSLAYRNLLNDIEAKLVAKNSDE
jgi:DNA mismatch repair enzyme (predicted ATPase)